MTDMLVALAMVALGGGLGGAARFWVSGVVARRYGETFPWGTMVVNVSGAAAIGVLAALVLAAEGSLQPGPAWSGLAIGVLGSYTTVSSFSLQTLALARAGETGRALANIGLSLGLCLLVAGAAWLGTQQLLALWGSA